jgi:NADPH-ferrihemoprotein reductase
LRQNTDEGSTLEVSFDLRKAGLTYKTATNLAIFPKNSNKDVEECAKRLGYDLNQRFAFVTNPLAKKKDNAKHPFPSPITIREAIEHFVDLRGAIRKKTLKDLSAFCSDEDEKMK